MIKNIFVFLNLIFGLLLVLSGFSIYFNPNSFWLISYLGLTYPILLVVNLLFSTVWLLLFKKKQYIFISLVAILFTWTSFKNTFSISLPSRSANDISILTWNVKNFDLYNWSNNLKTNEFMMDFLEEEKPDILCIQEFYTETKGSFKNIKEIKQRLGYQYYYFGETYSIKKGSKKWGLITFSKYPIKNKGIISFDSGPKLNAAIYTDIAYQKDSIIRVYNTHLQSIHFADEDYKYLSELKDEHKADFGSSLKILRKLKTGFIKRANQAKKVKAHAIQFSGKKIICGDFNDTPSSFAYNTLKEGLSDAFNEKGNGFGNTWVNPSPFFRIDFILNSKDIRINSYKNFSNNYSDHYPVKVYFNIP